MAPLHPLFTAPADEVDLAMVKSFLALEIEENLTVEYKSAGDSGTLLEAAAAMANTYGGIILYGVQPHPVHRDRPGELSGVTPDEKEKLVNKGASGFDPPWWFPEIIPVQAGAGDKIVLILRVDPTWAPRPVLYKGSIRVRLNGRTDVADRRLARQMFEESELPASNSPQPAPRWPSAYMDPFTRHPSPPDVVLRLTCGQSMRAGPTRLSLGGTAFRAINQAINTQDVGISTLLGRGGGGPMLQNFDHQSFTSRLLRSTVGHDPVGGARRPDRRVECTFALSGSGRETELIICADALFWIQADPKMRLAFEDVIAAANVLARLLILRLLPAALNALIGTRLPVPTIELHIEGRSSVSSYGDEVPTSLSDLIILDQFGLPRADRLIGRGSELLPPELIDANDLVGAVNEALCLIVTDWGSPDPKIA